MFAVVCCRKTSRRRYIDTMMMAISPTAQFVAMGTRCCCVATTAAAGNEFIHLYSSASVPLNIFFVTFSFFLFSLSYVIQPSAIIFHIPGSEISSLSVTTCMNQQNKNDWILVCLVSLYHTLSLLHAV